MLILDFDGTLTDVEEEAFRSRVTCVISRRSREALEQIRELHAVPGGDPRGSDALRLGDERPGRGPRDRRPVPADQAHRGHDPGRTGHRPADSLPREPVLRHPLPGQLPADPHGLPCRCRRVAHRGLHAGDARGDRHELAHRRGSGASSSSWLVFTARRTKPCLPRGSSASGASASRRRAKKYVVDNNGDSGTTKLEFKLSGLDRPIFCKRPHYFDLLQRLRSERGLVWADFLVVGDIFELDLALPLILGANVALMRSPTTPSYEIRLPRDPRQRAGARQHLADPPALSGDAYRGLDQRRF